MLPSPLRILEQQLKAPARVVAATVEEGNAKNARLKLLEIKSKIKKEPPPKRRRTLSMYCTISGELHLVIPIPTLHLIDSSVTVGRVASVVGGLFACVRWNKVGTGLK